MRRIDVANLITAMANIATAIGKIMDAADQTRDEYLVFGRTDRVLGFLAGSITHAMKATERFGLPHSHASAKRCNAAMATLASHMQRGPVPRHSVSDLTSQCNQLAHTLADELESRTVLMLDDESSRYLEENAASFGADVDQAFPASTRDIRDAGRCMAYGLWTASVMHLMRACEAAIKSLGAKYGLSPNTDWNNVVQQLPGRLERVGGKNSPERTWAVETGMHFNFIRDGFRNHAMHGSRYFGEEEARSIYTNTRAFMRQVAKKMILDPDWQESDAAIDA